MLKNKLIEHEGVLYVVLRKVKKDFFTDQYYKNLLILLNAERVLQSKTHYLYCIAVQDVEFEEQIA